MTQRTAKAPPKRGKAGVGEGLGLRARQGVAGIFNAHAAHKELRCGSGGFARNQHFVKTPCANQRIPAPSCSSLVWPNAARSRKQHPPRHE